jgi:hypothetical protein
MSSSKMVNDRQRAATIVTQAALTHADQVGARLDQELAPASSADATGNIAALIRRLGQTLKASIDELVAADRVHESEKADDVEVRQELDEAIDGVYREVVDFRAVLEGVGGTAATAQAGLAGATPREPIALGRLAHALHDRLPALTGVTSMRRGVTFDAMAYAEPLKEALSRLERAQQALRREERELEATLMAKNRVMSAHDTRFLTIARTLESLFRLAGFEELANRVRPSARRPGLVENDPGPLPAPGASEASEPASEPTAP